MREKIKRKSGFKKYWIILIVVILIAVIGIYLCYNYFREVKLSPFESNLLNQEPLCDITCAESPGGTNRCTLSCNDWSCKEKKKYDENYECCNKKGGECSRYENGERCTPNCKWNVCGDGFILDGEDCDPPNDEIYEDSVMKCNDECKSVCKEDTVNPNNECQKCANEEWVNKTKEELTPFCEFTLSGKSKIMQKDCNKIEKVKWCSLWETPTPDKKLTLVTKWVGSYNANKEASDYILGDVCLVDAPIECNVDVFRTPCEKNGGICLFKESIDEAIDVSNDFDDTIKNAIREHGYDSAKKLLINEVMGNQKISESKKENLAGNLFNFVLNSGGLGGHIKKKIDDAVKYGCSKGKLEPCAEGGDTDCEKRGDYCCLPKSESERLSDEMNEIDNVLKDKRTNVGVDTKEDKVEKLINKAKNKVKELRKSKKDKKPGRVKLFLRGPSGESVKQKMERIDREQRGLQEPPFWDEGQSEGIGISIGVGGTF